VACRDEAKAVQAVNDVKASLGPSSKISSMKLDLSSLQSVRDFAAEFSASKCSLMLLMLLTEALSENVSFAADEHIELFVMFFLGLKLELF